MGMTNTVFPKKLFVVSGINLFTGGGLSVFHDFLDELDSCPLAKNYRIVVFVHKTELFQKYKDKNFCFIELPKSRKSYLYRLYYEYCYFKKFSKKNNVDVWFSLHDITPNVIAKKRFVYCHNPSPFRKISALDLKMGFKNILFPLLYKWVYKINIKKNTNVIVQQKWLKDEFVKHFKINNVIAARPSVENTFPSLNNKVTDTIIFGENRPFSFFYPAFPRVFKNFETVCEAAKLIDESFPELDFLVFLTINGTENRYSRYLYKKYGRCKRIKWLGLLGREETFAYYQLADCLLFPSKAETWGLPLSEFKPTSKEMIVADLPYAKETILTYDTIAFFNPTDYKELARLMAGAIRREPVFNKCDFSADYKYDALGWKQLLRIMLNED